MLNPIASRFSLPRLVGTENADSMGIRLFESNAFLVALADGVGKSAYSPDASKAVTSVVTASSLTKEIQEIFHEAQNALIDGAAKTPGFVWSTTLTVCRVADLQASVGHVGDSRLYHLRGKGIVTRTRDQTELQALIDEGVISKERAKKYPRKNVLLSALSSESSYDLQLSTFEVASGDRLLLISDGVYKQILRREIADISANSASTDELIARLRQLLLSRGIVDDSSAICIEIQ
jgi:PPM family protein phosphatase